jgi:hypothetical protein
MVFESQQKRDKKSFIGLLCLAGALRSNKQSLQELWGPDGEDTGKLL